MVILEVSGGTKPARGGGAPEERSAGLAPAKQPRQGLNSAETNSACYSEGAKRAGVVKRNYGKREGERNRRIAGGK